MDRGCRDQWDLERRREESWKVEWELCVLVLKVCHGWNYVLSNSYTEVLNPDVTIFGESVFSEVIKVKWGDKRDALIQEDLCPQNRETLESSLSLSVGTEERPNDNTERSCMSRRGLTRTQLCFHLNLPASRIVGTCMSVAQGSQSMVVAYYSLNWLIQTGRDKQWPAPPGGSRIHGACHHSIQEAIWPCFPMCRVYD